MNSNNFQALAESVRTQIAYSEVGLQTGVLDYEQIVAWADAVLLQEAEPPVEIVDIALARSRTKMLDVLASLRLEAVEREAAGRMLFATLAERLRDDGSRVFDVSERAVQISRITGQDDSIYYRLAHVDDDLDLIKKGILADAWRSSCVDELLDILSENGILGREVGRGNLHDPHGADV